MPTLSEKPTGIPNHELTCFVAPLILAMCEEPLLGMILSADVGNIVGENGLARKVSLLQRVLCSAVLQDVEFDRVAYHDLLVSLGVLQLKPGDDLPSNVNGTEDIRLAWEGMFVPLLEILGIFPNVSWQQTSQTFPLTRGDETSSEDGPVVLGPLEPCVGLPVIDGNER